MKWILFFQNPHNRVTFLTDENQDRSSKPYKQFCEMLFKFPIIDPGGLQDHIDTFHTIYLNLETGQWNVVQSDQDITKIQFEDLVKANPTGEEKDKQEKMKKEREVTLTKDYFSKVWENKKKEIFKGYYGK